MGDGPFVDPVEVSGFFALDGRQDESAEGVGWGLLAGWGFFVLGICVGLSRPCLGFLPRVPGPEVQRFPDDLSSRITDGFGCSKDLVAILDHPGQGTPPTSMGRREEENVIKRDRSL